MSAVGEGVAATSATSPTSPTSPTSGGRIEGRSGGGGRARRDGSLRSAVRLLAVVLLLGALAAAGLTTLRADRASADADARSAALAAARTRVPALLSYDADTLADDLATARAQTAGRFARDYATILADVLSPQASARRITTAAQVRAAGVVRGDRRRVVVLLFLTQTTTAAAGATSVSGSRVEVTMIPVGDGWKIAGLRPV